MLVEVFSDVVCPWCWLGKRRLERALAGIHFADEVEVRWRAFQLDPSAPPEPQHHRDVLARKYGGREVVATMTQRLTDLGRSEGLEYRWDRVRRVNSFDAHRLLAWSGDEGDQATKAALEERLFRGYFTEGANVADREQLAAFAADIGLDDAEARAVLASARYGDEVRADRDRALELDVMGVPAFVLQERLMIPGAQEAETFRLLLTRAHERLVP
jgi:predicted DsbA family dithiol-disulfide isomerase